MRLLRLPALAVLVAALVACTGPVAAPASPTVPPTPTAPPATSSPPPSSPGPGASTPGPGSTPSSIVPAPTGCPPIPTFTGAWPSNRLVAVEAVDGGYEDLVRFRFAMPAQGAASTVAVHRASGPFTQAGSGAPVQVAGTTYMEVRAEGLVLVDGAGRPTFAGERDLRPSLVTVRQVVAIDESEGVMAWIVGADYSCVSIRSTPGDGTITLGFTHAVP